MNFLRNLIVDLRCSRQKQIETLKQACETDGFFFLSGHNLDVGYRKYILNMASLFFDLDGTIKSRYAAGPDTHNRGWTSFASEKLDPGDSSNNDTNESFYIGPEREVDVTRPLQGPNQWLDSDSLPAQFASWNIAMSHHYFRMMKISQHVNQLLSMVLDYPSLSNHFSDPMAYIRLLHYPPIPSVKGQTMGSGEHTDYGHLTLLLIDGQPGLQIYSRTRNIWIDVHGQLSDYLIVNVGDLLEKITDHRFCATKHRVLIPENANDRYSIAHFYDPNYDASIRPLNNPSADPIRPGKYLLSKYQQTYDSFQ